jgi:hypothetical protein
VIQFLTHHQIDRHRWDLAIEGAVNGLIYANSEFLDAMSPGWHALVYGDYEAVMPLTWRSKLGINYLCQPAFAQQLGVFFAPDAVEAQLVPRFLMAVSQRYRLTEIFLNHQNLTQGVAGIHQNYTLWLGRPYAQIAAGYKSDLQKNLNRAQRFNLVYEQAHAPHTAIDLYANAYGKNMRVRPVDYAAFAQLCQSCLVQNRAIVRSVRLPHTGEVLAIGLFLRDNRRIYNLASTTLPNGRTLEANHWLFDQLIREFAGQAVTLDFEGSDIGGIGRFYQKFGSTGESYYFWKSNRLPAVIRWWKR